MVQVKPSIHISLIGLVGWLHIFEYHGVLILDKSPVKWRKRLDMTIAVDWDVKHQFKQTNKEFFKPRHKV